MATPVAFLLALFAIFIGKYLKRNIFDFRKFKGPSPWTSLPIIGHCWQFGKDPVRVILDLRRRYGDLVRFDVGSLPTIILYRYEDVVELLAKDSVAGRSWSVAPWFRHILDRTKDGSYPGIGISEGKTWTVQRKFMMATLKKVVGSSTNLDSTEYIVSCEASNLCNILGDMSKDGPIHINNKFAPAINNIVMNITMGTGSRQTDPSIVKFTSDVAKFFQAMVPSNIVEACSMHNYVFNRFVKNISGKETYIEYIAKIKQSVKSSIDKLLPMEHGNYVERYKFEMRKFECDQNSSFNGLDGERNLNSHILDMFFAGTDTATAFLEYSVKYLVAFPDVQTKLHQELMEVVGSERPPRFEDRLRLPYMQAFLQEAMRFTPMITLPIPRRTTSMVALGNGITIPTNTQIIFCATAVHKDERNFAEPETFRPERFIDGTTGQFLKSEKVVLFGSGKRRCPGEHLARLEIFLIMANIVQKFRLTATGPIDFTDVPGTVFSPAAFAVNFETR